MIKELKKEEEQKECKWKTALLASMYVFFEKKFLFLPKLLEFGKMTSIIQNKWN